MGSGSDSILDMYLYETNTLLEQLDGILLAAEQADTFSQDSVNEIFRIMHTIKGSSAMMEFPSLMTVAHRIEDLFFIIREKTMEAVPEALRPELFDMLFQAVDFFRGEIEKIENGEPLSESIDSIVDKINSLVNKIQGGGGDEAKDAPAAGTAAPEAPVAADQAYPFGIHVFFDEGSGMENLRAFMLVTAVKDYSGDFITVPENVETDPSTAEAIAESGFFLWFRDAGERDAAIPGVQGAGSVSSYEPVDAKAAAPAPAPAPHPAPPPPDMDTSWRSSVSLRSSRADLVKLSSRSPFRSGEAVTMDSVMTISLTTAMSWSSLVRLTLMRLSLACCCPPAAPAAHTGSEVIIEIKDDGKGADCQAILNKAIRQGLADPDHEYSQRDILNFMMMPGFSTNVQVTEFSGRGVGMDVVKKNVADVGGTVSISSEWGKGMTTTLKIPLTMAIMDGMEVSVGESLFTIPINNIRSSARVSAGDVIRDPARGEMMKFQDNFYPIIRAKELFGLEDGHDNIEDGIVIWLEAGECSYCLFVDDLLGQQQIVVKPLPGYVNSFDIKSCGITGCSIMGDGSISIILDIASLYSAGQGMF